MDLPVFNSATLPARQCSAEWQQQMRVYQQLKARGVVAEKTDVLSCDALVALPDVPDALSVPFAAVGDNPGTPVVAVIRGGKVDETEVEVGAETRDLVQVTGRHLRF